ncbi:MAG: hypothetical protein Q4A69_02095 [Moraxella sp.]|nr:hypothetical protein [Moraxella sp.]
MITELIPEIFSIFRELKIRKNYLAISVIVMLFFVCIVLYHNIYLPYSLFIIMGLFVCYSICHFILNTEKIDNIGFIPIKNNLSAFSKKIPITYDKIMGSIHKIIVKDNEFTFVLSAKSGCNYLMINDEKFNSIKISPIFNFGTIFLQRVIDDNGNKFFISVKLKGFLSCYISIDVKKIIS